MITVDERIGSRDLLPAIRAYGADAELGRLEFGDFAFVGRGKDETDILIGIELKETRDLVSSLQSSRFAGHQLGGLQKMYERAWLLTEGIWRDGEGGVLEVLTGSWRKINNAGRFVMYRDVESWLLTQTIRGGLSHWHCNTRRDTVRFIVNLYRWWTLKSFAEHRSHQVIYEPPPDRAMLTEPTTFLRMLACVDKVGYDKAIAISQIYGSVGEIRDTTERELRLIPGIGPVVASNIKRAFQ